MILSLENPLLLHYTKTGLPGWILHTSKGHHTRGLADTYLKLRDWEGKVSVFGPDVATGVLEIFHWYIL